MNINIDVSKGNTISEYLAGLLVHGTQLGMGILGFQRIIAKEAGHDAWISVILAGLVTHLTLWIIIKTMQKYPSADIYGIQDDVFGRWLGTAVSIIFIIYFILTAGIILRSYIEVVQTWVFPNLPTWILAGIILFLAFYTIVGGIRVIAGYTFFSIIATAWLVFDLYFPLEFARWEYLFPIMDTSFENLFRGMMAMSLTSVGFEVLYVVYPYVQNKDRVNKSAQLAVLVTYLIYLLVMIVTLVFFSQGQLMRTIWATLNLQKMVYLPILERFELVVISLWLIVILPNIMLYLWCSARGLKRLFCFNLRSSLYWILSVIYLASLTMLSRQQMNWLYTMHGKISIWVVYLYPYFLYVMVLLKQRTQRAKSKSKGESA
ncbi:GerAB/ArcD/ProY family transporter [Brevibacillus sp. MS2.2]|uniref:GerAB/ArcD/ProY family transporter n=1 Tax=Brevibacillus sp. MS2.2 TaxID=2738981 RepID=UPI00156B71C6|nr:GerAB/ArcD/ProY family transporter [Brevibacillus sp. MS2.2]NRR21718.1 GerAB/ArcD/ProY family transporter [Brevibacillus sp. MS2.2]